MKKYIWLVFVICFWTSCAFAAKLNATLNSDKVAYNNTFELNISYDGKDGASLQPDFGVLQKDFYIYGNTTFVNANYVNGSFSQSKTWTLTLMSKKEGKVEIPAIKAGKYKTEPLQIEVLPAGTQTESQKTNNIATVKTDEKIELSVNVDNSAPYVQQEVNMDVIIKDGIGIQIRQEPQFLNADDWIIKPLKQPTVVSNADGSRDIHFYYAIFAQKSGKLALPTISIDGLYQDFTAQNPLKGRMSFFQMLSSDFDNFFGQMKPIVLQSKPQIIEVKPIASAYNDEYWLPAEALSFNAQWVDKPKEIKQGDALTRQIELAAYGVADTQLPLLEFAQSDDFKQYPEKPQIFSSVQGGKILSKAVYNLVYIAQKSGDLTVPALKIKWFNVLENKAEESEIPAETLFVKQVDMPKTNKTDDDSLQTKQENEVLQSRQVVHQKSTLSVFALAGLLLGSFLFGIGFCYLLFFRAKNAQKNENNASLGAIKENLNANDYRQLRNSLILWANKNMPGDNVNNLNDLAKVVNDERFYEQIQILNRILYANSNEVLDDKSAILSALKKCVKEKKTAEKSACALPKLYK